MIKYNKKLINQIIKDRKVRVRLAKKSHEWFFSIYLNHYIKYPSAPFHDEFFRITEDNSIKNAVIISFRNSAKSTILSLSYPLWAIVGEQQKKYVVILGRTQRQARQYLLNIKRELETNPLFRADMGPFKEETDEWGSLSLVIPKYGAKITIASTEQSIRGSRHGQFRPDLIIGDDLENLESARNQESRDKLFDWFAGDIIPAGDSDTKVIIVGNLLHGDSLLMRLIKNIKSNKFTGIYRRYPLINKNGRIAWPGKFPTRESIKEFRKTLPSEDAWQRECLLHLTPKDSQVVFRDWIQHYDKLPDQSHEDYQFTAIGVDVAISEKTNSHYTGIVCAHVYGRRKDLKIYIDLIINKRIDFPTTIDTIKNLYNTFGKKSAIKIFVEKVAYQAAVPQQLQRDGYNVEGVEIRGDKLMRLTTKAPLIKNTTILFPKTGAERLIDQIVNFGIEKYDDLADAFTLLIYKIMEIDDKPIPNITVIETTYTPRRGLADDDSENYSREGGWNKFDCYKGDII